MHMKCVIASYPLSARISNSLHFEGNYQDRNLQATEVILVFFIGFPGTLVLPLDFHSVVTDISLNPKLLIAFPVVWYSWNDTNTTAS